jgi:hypothetical protein
MDLAADPTGIDHMFYTITEHVFEIKVGFEGACAPG